MRIITAGCSLVLLALGPTAIAACSGNAKIPPLEPIDVVELPLLPVVATDEPGACTRTVNPHGTGCMGRNSELNGGSFTPDSNYVLASVNFTGAPNAPDPASIYTGVQLIMVSTNGSVFSTGDPWKCLTCGVPDTHKVGTTTLDVYPQTFTDGRRALVGNNIVECRSGLLSSDQCTSNNTYIYPIRLSNTADDSGEGGTIRELRLHPDSVHLGFNSYGVSSAGQLSEYAYFGRLRFNPAPATGSPLSARYDLVNVTILTPANGKTLYQTKGDQLLLDREAITMGEFRGFTGRGEEILYLGAPWESCNVDLFAAHLTTGRVRRVTTHPEYVDPVGVSADGRWQVILDTRGSGRMMFLSAMRGVPPVVDLLTVTTVSSVRNNGDRRFFQPWLLDAQGDNDLYHYYGQQINAAGDGSPGSINDPNWNAGADPRWSPDGTRIMYWQKMPYQLPPVAPVPDEVPWGVPYVSGGVAPTMAVPPEGNFTLYGQISGSAQVVIRKDPVTSAINFVAVRYSNFSDDGMHFIHGSESVQSTPQSTTMARLNWYSNLTATGLTFSTKTTGPGGFQVEDDAMLNIFRANGTLTTTVDGVVYEQPLNYS
ncbi:saponin hydrolase precursor [Aspergillus sclerotioniger CBS 115572]|uniref:Saponin hydrolase n=1 Tax=Aspergillus sclerotioniger CBS 115572 TaxID=1450535 RepID=A0A317VVP3_9EURO|nr:saponin hydrolase precursor [Aspergillus sclerotioniger CBS 115572]PWY78446.1 saponin hydrolase precursor [Aspergillus sclerotioniger CBS 115572]